MPYRSIPEHDESVPDRSLVRDVGRSKLGAVAAARENLIAGTLEAVAADVGGALDHSPTDAVAFDFLLLGALFAAERAGIPAAMLIHTVYPFPAPGMPPYGMGWDPATGPAGRLHDRVGRLMYRQAYERPLIPRFNAVRDSLGLGPLVSFDDLVSRVQRALVLTSPAFDFAARLPANVEYVGPQLDNAELAAPWEPPWSPGDERPLVVVGLSTTYLAQGSLLERIVAALATLPVRALVTTGDITLRGAPPPNVHVARYVPHARVLPEASLVVTNAGLGTVHAALTQGLPIVCLPIGRDQPDNAARVVRHGAGVRLSPKSGSVAIGAAIQTVLGEPTFSAAARRLAAAIADERPADRGPDTLERVAALGTRSRST